MGLAACRWLRKSHTDKRFGSPGSGAGDAGRIQPALSDRERALAVILDEHRSIACVARGMLELVSEARECKVALDLRSLEGMLTYMREFPLRLHHPRKSSPSHAASASPRLRDLASGARAAARAGARTGCDSPRPVVRASKRRGCCRGGRTGTLVETMAGAVWRHLCLEEDKVLPMAEAHLREGDWTEMAVASRPRRPRIGPCRQPSPPPVHPHRQSDGAARH